MAVLTGWDMVLLESALLVNVVIIVAILFRWRCTVSRASTLHFLLVYSQSDC